MDDNHTHQPETPTPVNVLPDNSLHVHNLDGFIQTLEFVPTYTPSRFLDQFVIVTSGGSSRAYIYDTKPTGGKAWRFTTLT